MSIERRSIHDYLPLTESAYYILLSLLNTRHGYGIIQYVEQLTEGRIRLGPGTVYGSLSRMDKDGWIQSEAEEQSKRRKLYRITDAGKQLLFYEVNRIKQLHEHAMKAEAAAQPNYEIQ
jgi:DNA-binding PadR family transcriptional regulator